MPQLRVGKSLPNRDLSTNVRTTVGHREDDEDRWLSKTGDSPGNFIISAVRPPAAQIAFCIAQSANHSVMKLRGNFHFRTREFEQMEMEYSFDPVLMNRRIGVD